MFSAQPQPTTRSASLISSAASGVANPPLMSRSHGLPRNSPRAAADVASSAPQPAASRASAGPAPPCPARPCRAPRPAMNTGRRARASAAASCSTVSAGGAPPAIATAPVTLAAVVPGTAAG